MHHLRSVIKTSSSTRRHHWELLNKKGTLCALINWKVARVVALVISWFDGTNGRSRRTFFRFLALLWSRHVGQLQPSASCQNWTVCWEDVFLGGCQRSRSRSAAESPEWSEGGVRMSYLWPTWPTFLCQLPTLPLCFLFCQVLVINRLFISAAVCPSEGTRKASCIITSSSLVRCSLSNCVLDLSPVFQTYVLGFGWSEKVLVGLACSVSKGGQIQFHFYICH